MRQLFKVRLFHSGGIIRRIARIGLPMLLLSCCALSSLNGFQAKPDKIQQSINAIKKAHYCEDADYHTDGQRTVWVKSYKRWKPSDMQVIKKEAPYLLNFFADAIKYNRLDVLEQLLPDYYRSHGGTKAFAADIKKTIGR